MQLSDLRKNAQTTLRTMNRLGISAVYAEDMPVEELVAHLAVAQGIKWIRTSTAERVRVAGFSLEPTLRPWHCTIWLPDPEDRTLMRLVEAFDAAERNPLYRVVARPVEGDEG
jgi:hypothetical protein